MADDRKVVPIGNYNHASQILRSFVSDDNLDNIEDVMVITRDKDGELHVSHNTMSLERMVFLATALYKHATE